MGCNESRQAIPKSKTVKVTSTNAKVKTEVKTKTNSEEDNKNLQPVNTQEIDIPKLTGKKRIIRELKYFNENAPTNMRMDPSFDGSDLNKWTIDIDGASGTIYKGEKFKLKLVFKDEYPAKAPTITFIPGHVPMHPHIYSNGHMCLEILYEGYKPEMTIVYICNCIMLMLDCNTKREWPYNDSWYLRMNITNPNHGMWAWEETY